MGKGDAVAPHRVGLLFTRYPVSTETFLQREVEVLCESGEDFRILALWPSSRLVEGPVPPDHVFQPMQLIGLLWWIPYWAVRNPAAMARVASALLAMRVPNLVNLLENLLGLGYGIVRARSVMGRFSHMHAVWASAPATAAWVLRQLTGIPFSMAGHAYDIFENGGDGLLEVKIPSAAFIRTSTEAGKRRWEQLGAPAGKIHVIRRGLVRFPEFKERRPIGRPLRILSVGRLVEKMGYPFLLEMLATLRKAGVEFTATIIGGGPLEAELRNQCARLALREQVFFTGFLPFPEVGNYLRRADLFLFTGRVARDGDRAGLPNALAEAMAWGVPVCATRVGAVEEAVLDGVTGLILSDPSEIRPLLALIDDQAARETMRRQARAWVEQRYDARKNVAALRSLWKYATF
ncbi:MAG: glycosyltransferase [Oceanipulchritudo sp.]